MTAHLQGLLESPLCGLEALALPAEPGGVATTVWASPGLSTHAGPVLLLVAGMAAQSDECADSMAPQRTAPVCLEGRGSRGSGPRHALGLSHPGRATMADPPWTSHAGRATLDEPPWMNHPGPAALDAPPWTRRCAAQGP